MVRIYSYGYLYEADPLDGASWSSALSPSRRTGVVKSTHA
jgi:hypothetical protein